MNDLRPEDGLMASVERSMRRLQTSQGAWVCPKCGRVYGPGHPQCWPCNNEIDDRQKRDREHKRHYPIIG